MFNGSLVALITPFKNGAVDEKGFEKFVAWQIKEGTDGLVPCGTTGESPTLSMIEHKRVIDICIAAAKGSGVPVIAGTGSNSTDEAIELTRHARKAGADAAMLVVPYYNKPTQEGLYQHFKAIASAVKLPVIVYSVQSRTAVNVEPSTLKRLAEVDYIAGVKEASGNIGQMAAVIQQVPATFAVLSGDDSITIPLIALGGHGIVSVVSNEIPKEMTALTQHALAGEFAAARDLQSRYFALMEVNFIESSPIPVKTAMALMGLLEPVWRLPMCPASPGSHAKIEKVLETLGLLAGWSVHAS